MGDDSSAGTSGKSPVLFREMLNLESRSSLVFVMGKLVIVTASLHCDFVLITLLNDRCLDCFQTRGRSPYMFTFTYRLDFRPLFLQDLKPDTDKHYSQVQCIK